MYSIKSGSESLLSMCMRYHTPGSTFVIQVLTISAQKTKMRF